MSHQSETIDFRPLWKLVAIVPIMVTAAACVPLSFAESTDSADTTDSAEDAVYRVDTDDPVVFLTIDDGATREPMMADVLADAGVEATLFLTDQYVQQDADFFRRLRDETGATIQNHTLDHPDLTSVSDDEQRRQICETADRFEEEFGRRPTLMRPPYGSFDDVTQSAAAECGATHVVHWSAVIDNGDIEHASGDELSSGDIVLMHFTENFEDDVETFIEEADRAGLEPALLEDYLP